MKNLSRFLVAVGPSANDEASGLLPSTGQVQVWYQNQPPGALLRARGTAENALLAYSQEVSAAVEAELREEVENGIIVAEIRESKRFWPQFGMNVVGGLASGILFAAILAIFTFLVHNDTSPVDIVKKSSQSAQGVGNGK